MMYLTHFSLSTPRALSHSVQAAQFSILWVYFIYSAPITAIQEVRKILNIYISPYFLSSFFASHIYTILLSKGDFWIESQN